jgi:hypothetical protein
VPAGVPASVGPAPATASGASRVPGALPAESTAEEGGDSDADVCGLLAGSGAIAEGACVFELQRGSATKSAHSAMRIEDSAVDEGRTREE